MFSFPPPSPLSHSFSVSYARFSPKHVTWVILCSLLATLWSMAFYYSHFTNEEIEEIDSPSHKVNRWQNINSKPGSMTLEPALPATTHHSRRHKGVQFCPSTWSTSLLSGSLMKAKTPETGKLHKCCSKVHSTHLQSPRDLLPSSSWTKDLVAWPVIFRLLARGIAVM